MLTLTAAPFLVVAAASSEYHYVLRCHTIISNSNPAHAAYAHSRVIAPVANASDSMKEPIR
jgi:hypothetical protein